MNNTSARLGGIIFMLRLYCTGSTLNKEGFITVWDYASYEPIAHLSMKKESRQQTKDLILHLLNLSDKEYIKHLLGLKIKETRLLRDRDKDREEWIKGAWIYVTNSIFKELNINPKNEPISNVKDILDIIDSEAIKEARKAKKAINNHVRIKKTKSTEENDLNSTKYIREERKTKLLKRREETRKESESKRTNKHKARQQINKSGQTTESISKSKNAISYKKKKLKRSRNK